VLRDCRRPMDSWGGIFAIISSEQSGPTLRRELAFQEFDCEWRITFRLFLVLRLYRNSQMASSS
jgi:hypothetical protein